MEIGQRKYCLHKYLALFSFDIPDYQTYPGILINYLSSIICAPLLFDTEMFSLKEEKYKDGIQILL
jgi:hypothetical protein